MSIANHTYLGYHTELNVGERIWIGNHVLGAYYVFFAGYDAHPLNPVDRAANKPPDAAGSGSIVVVDYIGICNDATIPKNLTIGKGGVVVANAVVTKAVEPLTIVAGNPAKVVKCLDQYCARIGGSAFVLK